MDFTKIILFLICVLFVKHTKSMITQDQVKLALTSDQMETGENWLNILKVLLKSSQNSSNCFSSRIGLQQFDFADSKFTFEKLVTEYFVSQIQLVFQLVINFKNCFILFYLIFLEYISKSDSK